MRTVELLEQALADIGIPARYYEYVGKAEEYIVYNEEAEEPAYCADDEPQGEVSYWQVHIFTPKKGNFRQHKETVKEALVKRGFVIETIKTLFEIETTTIHVVILCNRESEG